jgi:hypothetical protein
MPNLVWNGLTKKTYHFNLAGVNERLRHEIDEDGIVVYEKA